MINLNAPPLDCTTEEDPAIPVSTNSIEELFALLTIDSNPDRATNDLLGDGDIPEEHNSSDTIWLGGSHAAQTSHKRAYKALTDDQKQQIYTFLLELSSNGKLKKDSTAVVAQALNVKKDAVQRVWRRVKECRAAGKPVDVKSRKLGNCGRKKKDIHLSRVKDVPLNQRSTLRGLAEDLGTNRSTLHRRFKEGLLRRHSSTLKPLLKEGNKIERLKFCLSMLDPHTIHAEPKFVDMENIVHIDEKWFYTIKKKRKYYLLPDEPEPHRTVHNKNSVGKVMFLSAVARPRYDEEGNCIFDGKLGIWPFVRKVPAQRSSANRERSTEVTKNMNVDRNLMKAYVITKVLPAIRRKFPRNEANMTIYIQQDNARTHVQPDDAEFRTAVQQLCMDIRLMNQPPNSPDLNALDLGFFASLQSLTEKRTARNIDELISNVECAFKEYDPSKLTRVFVTLQACMLEILNIGGGNRYKIPHMNKERISNAYLLPRSLACKRELYERAMETIGDR